MEGMIFFSLILMGGELRSHVQLAGVTWVMFLKGRDSQLQRTNAIVSTVFQSSLVLLTLLLHREPHPHYDARASIL